MSLDTAHIINDCDEAIEPRRRIASGSSDANRVQPEDFGSIRSLSSDSSQIKQVSQWSALFMTVNVTIGAGLLAIPAGLQTSGLFIALALQGFMLIMIIGSCIMLTYLTAVSGANSYHELLEIYGNKLLFNLCNTFVLLLTFGTAVAFQVIIADQFDRVYDTLYGNNFCHTWYLSRSFTMTVTTFFMIGPLCYSKSIGFLKYASFLGIISIGFISYVVISELLNHDPPELPVNFYPKKWTDSFSLVPSLCFAYQCHLSWVPTAAALPRMEKKKSCVTVTAALIVASIVYTVVSSGALLTFGGAIQDDFMENFSERTPILISAILILALKCILTYPLMIFPARISTSDALCSSFVWFASLDEKWRRYSISTAWITLSYVLALFVPSIMTAIDILGCLAAVFVFVFPAIAWMNYVMYPHRREIISDDQSGSRKHEEISWNKKGQMIICCIYIVFGSFVFGLILSNAIERLVWPPTPRGFVCV